MRKLALAVLMLTAVTLTACENPVEPTKTDPVFILTIPYPHITGEAGGTPVDALAGSEVDHSSWYLGLSILRDPHARNITSFHTVVSPGETVAVAIGFNGAPAIQSNTAATYRFFSDWRIASAEPGLVQPMQVEFSFLILKSVRNGDDNVNAPPQVVLRTSTSVATVVELNFPADDTTRFVVPRQIIRLGCRDDGTAILTGMEGLTEEIRAGENIRLYKYKVPRLTPTCHRYESVPEMRAALGQL